MGPSLSQRKNRVTTKGCSCQQTWSYKTFSVTDFCSAADSKDGREWCFVETGTLGTECQGDTWGYCAPRPAKGQLCGASCKILYKRMRETLELLDRLTFVYGSEPKAYAYVKVYPGKVLGEVPVDAADKIEASFLHGGNKVLFTASKSSENFKGRHVIHLCGAWQDLCDGDLDTCLKEHPEKFALAVGTIVHETMHHHPVGFLDFIYFRDNIQAFLKANERSALALKVVRMASDPVEYFIEDNNGFDSKTVY